MWKGTRENAGRQEEKEGVGNLFCPETVKMVPIERLGGGIRSIISVGGLRKPSPAE